MNVKKLPTAEAVGHILLHNQTAANGRKLFKKGHKLLEKDVAALQSIGCTELYVAIMEPGDVGENEAARRLGEKIVRQGLVASTATAGRVNLLAKRPGLIKVNIEALAALNDCSGITLGTIPTNSPVQPKKFVGTIKIIPYSVPGNILATAEAIADEDIVTLTPFAIKQAILITTGSQAARQKVVDGFTPPLRDRLASYNTQMVTGPYVPEDEAAIKDALQEAVDSGAGMILIAGETSIMDVDDITPRAIRAMGGQVIHHGVPVEPGNLLLLAYFQDIPIVGAPGCARSKNYNVVDMVLPRLAAGERLTRRDLVALGHGGLLK